MLHLIVPSVRRHLSVYGIERYFHAKENLVLEGMNFNYLEYSFKVKSWESFFFVSSSPWDTTFSWELAGSWLSWISKLYGWEPQAPKMMSIIPFLFTAVTHKAGILYRLLLLGSARFHLATIPSIYTHSKVIILLLNTLIRLALFRIKSKDAWPDHRLPLPHNTHTHTHLLQPYFIILGDTHFFHMMIPLRLGSEIIINQARAVN